MSELEATGHDSNRIEEHLIRIADRDGFPLVLPKFLPKTHRALILAEMARDRGPDAHWAVHMAIFHVYFGRGLDLNDEETLLDVARDHGLSEEDVREAWAGDVYHERLHQFRHVAIHMGITATPAALICNELLIGSRPYQVIRDAVDRCLVTADTVEEEAADAHASHG